MAKEKRTSDAARDEQGGLPAPVAADLPAAIEQAMAAMNRLCEGELEFAVAPAHLAGLETAVVLAITPGGLLPLFAHVSPDLAPLLVPAESDGDAPAALPPGVH